MPEIFNVEQGSPEWYQLRAGIPTSSEFQTIMAIGRGGGESVTRRKYMNRLAGEIITGVPQETYKNSAMDRGKVMEAEARETFAFITGYQPELIGFVREGRMGCSPDAFLGDGGVLEIKTAEPHILIDYIRNDKFPSEHWAQCQGALLVSGRIWCQIAIYWPGLPLFIRRCLRDEEYIRDLKTAIDAFNHQVDYVVDLVRVYGGGDGSQRLREQLVQSLETA